MRYREKGVTAFRGEVNQILEEHELARHGSEIINAFMRDDDIQEITVCSANLGIVLTYSKLIG